LGASPEHPFYVDGKGFVAAASLGVGTQIVTRAGPCLTVTAVEERHGAKGGYPVYNFVVPGDHTYFVGSLDGLAYTSTDSVGYLEQSGYYTDPETRPIAPGGMVSVDGRRKHVFSRCLR
jgi:hypothetical protein